MTSTDNRLDGSATGQFRFSVDSVGMTRTDTVSGAFSAVGGQTITETKPETRTRPVTDDGDHERFSHYVRKSDTVRAYVEGTPVRALCGKVWVPSRDPSLYPVCPTCAKIRERLLNRNNN